MTEAPDRRGLLQQALVAIDELETRLARAEQAQREPIAIVGMSCRFPGGANSPDEYWDLLVNGRDAITSFSQDRLEMVSPDADLSALGDPAGWFGGFLDQIDGFDPKVFGISPREANALDPQQRLVLEVAWEALERAAIAPDSLAGTATGVFVGISSNDFAHLAKRAEPDVYAATGGAQSVAAGRLAYTLGLQGPCMAVDTACSSSLVAVHLACQSLRTGESELALAGGVNVLFLEPEVYIAFDRWGMMAADGHCKTFDAAGDGYVRSEGCGMVVLKRLSDAEMAGDPILAVIRGSALNQDGASSGLTVPNGRAQQSLLRQAYRAAGIAPADVQYFEAHGTGTAIGDPIEVEAIGAVLGEQRPAQRQLVLGSAKSNVGHLEAAAGMAGLIKVVLAMQHATVPPNLHYHEPNPRIPWPPFPVTVPTEPVAWPETDGPRLAGVSGFGFSGTNAHLVIESAPPPDVVTADAAADPPRHHLLALSAASPTGLRELAARLAEHVEHHPDTAPVDLATTLARGRARFAHRAALVGATGDDVRARLAALAAGEDAPQVVAGQARRPRIGFLFTGQGSQFAGMGRGLYGHEPVFRAALDRCAELLGPLDVSNVPDWRGPAAVGLLDVMLADPADPYSALLGETCVTQPALLALEYALAEQWAAWGVTPAAVTGHSVGEFAAAVTAGVLTIGDALRLVAARGRLMQALPRGGAMLAVAAPLADVAQVVGTVAGELSVAAVNGPNHVVVSGAADAVARVRDAFAGRNVRVNELAVSHAFHSPLMRPMLDEFGDVARSIEYRPPQRPIVTNRGGRLAGAEIATADHWIGHVLDAVDFADGIAAMAAEGVDTFVELGPHPVLLAMAGDVLGDADSARLASLRRDRDEHAQLLASAGALFVRGAPIDLAAIAGASGRRRELPTYPFERTRYWLAPRESPAPQHRGTHPLLGRATPAPTLAAVVHDASVTTDHPAWVSDHRLFGTAVVPATAYVELALAASSGNRIRSLELLEPLAVPDGSPVHLQTVAVTDRDGSQTIEIVSLDSSPQPAPRAHARARVQLVTDLDAAARLDVGALAARYPVEVPLGPYYAAIAASGVPYGPAFRGLLTLHRSEDGAAGFVQLPAGVAAEPYALHPALLDACFHVIGATLASDGAVADDSALVPVGLRDLTLRRPGATAVWCVAELLGEPTSAATAAGLAARLALYDQDGELVASIERLDLRRVSRAAIQRSVAGEQLFYELAWRARELTPGPVPAGDWLVICDGAGIGASAARQLSDAGARCTVVRLGDDLDDADPAAWSAAIARPGVRWQGVVSVLGLDPRATSGDARTTALAATLQIVQALTRISEPPARLWLVTQGAVAVEAEPSAPDQATLWGFGRVVASEYPQLRCGLIDLDPAADDEVNAAALVAELAADTAEPQVAVRGGQRSVARLVRSVPDPRPVDGRPYGIRITTRGSLDNLVHTALERRSPGPGQVEVEVRATGVNFRDVLNVLGMYPGDPGPPGVECAGVVVAVGPDVTTLAVGDPVLGLAAQAYDSHVLTDARAVVAKPDQLTFAEAASIPVAFLTARYGLESLAQLQPGDSVLIHAAAGGVGMAAVRIAQRIGAEVYATAGSPRKHALLRDLGVRNIYSSRTLDFAEAILADTDGRGVDVVLNSLSDEFVTRSVDVLAKGGRFLEIGKRGIWSRERFATERPDATYHPYDLADLLEGGNDGVHALLGGLVADVVAGELDLLPIRAFTAGDVSTAFRYMAQARHVGKVVVTHAPQGPVVRPDATYLITGGLGGLGLALAEWLVGRGATHVDLVARRAPTDAAAAGIARMRAQGAVVRTHAVDVTNPDAVATLCARLGSGPVPLRGVFHAAGVIDDGVISRQTWDRFAAVLAPKADAAALLDRATRAFDLDHFVLYSSAAALFGGPGQANYAAANASLDALAHERRAAGLPALSVNWAAWAAVGMAARLDDRERSRLVDRGMAELDPIDALNALETLLASTATQVAVMQIDWPVLFEALPPGTRPPLFDELSHPDSGHRDRDDPRPSDVRATLAAADPDERRAVLDGFVREQIVRVLGLDGGAALDPLQGLSDVGMDSLMAVELSNRLRSGLELDVAATIAFEYPTFRDLSDYLAAELGVATGPGRRSDAAAPRPTPTSDVLALSDDEVAARLLRELDDSGY